MRSEAPPAAKPAVAVPVAPAGPAVSHGQSNSTEMQSSFAPLHARRETIGVRSVTNRVPVVVRANDSATASLAIPRTATSVSPSYAVPTVLPVGSGAAIATGQGGVSVVGRVMLHGTPPPEKRIVPDGLCGRLHRASFTTRHYVVDAEGGLANTFVYIKNGAAPTAPITEGPLLDQVGCEFQPYILGVQTGQIFKVRNSDPVLHNVHALPRQPGNKEQNIGQPVRGMATPFAFDRPEVFIQFKCEVHPWMFAYVGVVDHPWFAVTDGHGRFALPGGLPTGHYTIAAVHRKAGEILQQINVTERGIEPVNFVFEAPEPLVNASLP